MKRVGVRFRNDNFLRACVQLRTKVGYRSLIVFSFIQVTKLTDRIFDSVKNTNFTYSQNSKYEKK